jgi:signal transduction histidine kinase
MQLVTGYHETVLVVLSIIIAIFASYTALDLASRIAAARRMTRYLWTLAGAVAMGGGIWAMHFVGILAFRLPAEVTYDIPMTVLSAVVAMLVTGVGLHLIHELRYRQWLPFAGGLLMGGGIASMHYIGMAAMRIPGCDIHYIPSIVTLSVLIAVVAATAALWLVMTLKHTWERLASAAVMGLAIAGMHYTGMAAAQFYRFSGVGQFPDGNSLSPTLLAVAVASVTILLLCLALISTMVDRRLAVSARREADALRAAKDHAESANRTKDFFMAATSHELRTPLNAIIGFSELIKDRRLGDDLDRYVAYANDIHASGQHLLALIEDVLDITRLETGGLRLSEAVFDLGELAHACRAEIVEKADAAGVMVEIDLPPQSVQVDADRRRLRQILLNLLDNAVKFTPCGGRAAVTVNVGRDSGITLSVSDTGPGIPQEERTRIFHAFVQGDPRLERRHEGLGLGLPLARAFAELHGGRLDVESKPGEGSVFSLWLPPKRLHAPRNLRTAAEDPGAAEESGPLSSLRASA